MSSGSDARRGLTPLHYLIGMLSQRGRVARGRRKAIRKLEGLVDNVESANAVRYGCKSATKLQLRIVQRLLHRLVLRRRYGRLLKGRIASAVTDRRAELSSLRLKEATVRQEAVLVTTGILD